MRSWDSSQSYCRDENTDKNKQAFDIYKTLVNKHYKKPVDGDFEDATASILEGIGSNTEELKLDAED